MMSHPDGIGQMAALHSRAYRRRVRCECWQLAALVAFELALIGLAAWTW